MIWLRRYANPVCCLLLGACVVVLPVFASAIAQQNWPQRPLKILVPFAAGGNIDVMARLAAARLSETLGHQFIVENRVGANGSLATEAVARAAPDGYTFLWAPTSTMATFPAITKVNYDPVKDFAPISLFSVSPQVLVVNPEVSRQDGSGICRLCEVTEREAGLCRRRRAGQFEQSDHGDLPQARRA